MFFFIEFLNVYIFFLISIILTCVIFFLSYFFAIQRPDTEKLSAYECGFDPYEDARNAFDIRFYLVAILFIIFDLEAILIFPLTVSTISSSSLGFWVLIDFVIELFIGYIYVWRIGGLEWE